MASFKDKAGREWVIDITKGDVRRLTKLGIPFGELLGDFKRLANEVLTSPEQFDRVLWCLIESQAKAAGVSKDDFDDSWNGDTEEAAGLAFVDSVMDFSPARKVKGEMTTAFRAMEATQTEIAVMKIQEATEYAIKAMSENSTSTSSVANLKPSPESTAVGAVSAN